MEYADAACTELTSLQDISACSESTRYKPSEEMWTGGSFRNTSVVVVIGVMSNKVGSSSFHDIYLPTWGSYNTPENQLDFAESDLEGSASKFMPGSGHGSISPSIFEDTFVAQWGRSCLVGLEGDAVPCTLVDEESVPADSPLFLLVRHYLDPQTNTGPSREALPRHRVMIFDRSP